MFVKSRIQNHRGRRSPELSIVGVPWSFAKRSVPGIPTVIEKPRPSRCWEAPLSANRLAAQQVNC